MKIFTIGVYGHTEEEFFSLLTNNKIDLFCDIRQRRGVRGSQYRFVNSNYLQEKLSSLNINYLYEKALAPTREIREKQWAVDKERHQTKKYRDVLGTVFSACYCEQILNDFDLDALMNTIRNTNSENIVFFCVEAKAAACHRSLVANKIGREFGLEIVDL